MAAVRGAVRASILNNPNLHLLYIDILLDFKTLCRLSYSSYAQGDNVERVGTQPFAFDIFQREKISETSYLVL